MQNCDEGTRTVIDIPTLGNAYLISTPHATDEEYFILKLPFENRAENNKWRVAIDEIMRVINVNVAGVHDHYRNELEDAEYEIREAFNLLDK